MNEEITLKVAAKGVIVSKDGKVLILREAKTYGEGTNHSRFQLPGGRLGTRERYAEALHREILEETGLRIKVGIPVYVGEWFPEIKGVKHKIVAIYSVCYADETKVTLSTEHDKAEWIDPAKHADYDIIPPEHDVIAMYAELNKKGLV